VASFGSGHRHSPRPLIENTTKLASPRHAGVAREAVALRINGVEQVVEVVRQDRINDGQQAYWKCPKCAALRSHLYVLDGALACRVCHRLDYRSKHVLHPGGDSR